MILQHPIARQFSRLPDPAEARRMLRRLHSAPCHAAPRRVDKPVTLYGAGNLGQLAHAYFKRIGVTVQTVVDANADTLANTPFWQQTRLMAPEEVPNKLKTKTLLAICIANDPFTPVAEYLTRQGWQDAVPFYDIAEAYRDRHPLSNGWFTEAFSDTDLDRIETVLDGWHDAVSRAHHLQFIAWRRLRQEWTFSAAPVTTDDRFFIPEVLDCLNHEERFIDLGAHTGSVTRRFCQLTGGRFSELCLIEPDRTSLEQLEVTMDELGLCDDSRLRVMDCGIAARTGMGRFYEGLDYASQLTPLGKRKLPVVALDDLEFTPTFIKLHLEGGELDALKGAEQTLLSHRPIVVATSYHNAQGLWELPLWLMQTLPNYRFLLRLHSWCGTGAVIYALPNERSSH